MDRLQTLTRTLESIQRLAIKTIKEGLPLLHLLKKDQNDLVNDIYEYLKEESPENYPEKEGILEYCRERAMGMIEDAKAVKDEFEYFANAVVSGNESIEKAECPFFHNVWFGDMYDVEGIESLKILLKELKAQNNNLAIENFFSLCVEELMPPREKDSEEEHSEEEGSSNSSGSEEEPGDE